MIGNQELDFGRYDNLKYHKLMAVTILGFILFVLICRLSFADANIIMFNGTTAVNQIGYASADLRKNCQEFNNATTYNIKSLAFSLEISSSESDDYVQVDMYNNAVANPVLFSGNILRADINTSYNNFINVQNASLTTGAGKNYLICTSCPNCASGKNFEFRNQQTSKFNGMTWQYFYSGSYHNITGTQGVHVFVYNAPAVPPSITILSDLRNGTVTNSTQFNFYFNQTSINNSNNYWCGIYENTTLKNSINTTITGNKNLSFSLTGNYERYLNFTLNCFNENASSNLSALYYVDNVKSVLNYASPNGTYYDDVVLYSNFSISDTNLFAFEWLIYEGATLKENITHIGNIGGTYSVYNVSAVSQIVGNYNWVLNVWENHNPLSSEKLFKEYAVVKEPSKIVYNYADKNYSISSVSNMIVNSKTKDLKQYFDFTLAKGEIAPKDYTYYLEYDGKLIYLPDSEYKGHFVLWDIKRYVDFQCTLPVKVSKINSYKYQIVTSCTKFETTGNLNYMQFSGNFSIETPSSLSYQRIYVRSGQEAQFGMSISLSVLAFMFMYIAFKLDEKHAFLKILTFFFGVMCLLLLSNDMLANRDYCSIRISSQNTTTTASGTNQVFGYERVCFPYERQTPETAFKIVNYFIRILQAYMFLFIIYWIFDYLGMNLLELVRRIFKVK